MTWIGQTAQDLSVLRHGPRAFVPGSPPDFAPWVSRPCRPRRGIRRIFDGGALGAPTLPSPRYPAHGQGHGAFSRRGSLPRSSFLPKLRASDFCPISCRFRSGYCPSPPTRHDPRLGDAGIIPYLRPFDQPRLCELFPPGAGKGAGTHLGPGAFPQTVFTSSAAGRRSGSAPAPRPSRPPSAPGASRYSGPGTEAGP